jgi:hypothetical protein
MGGSQRRRCSAEPYFSAEPAIFFSDLQAGEAKLGECAPEIAGKAD